MMPILRVSSSLPAALVHAWITVIAAAFLLSACAETQLAIHAAKKMWVKAPKQEGVYKIGKPYQVGGAWYYPAVDYEYDETGIASWYGEKFHGKGTANGEIFDMNTVTAAHKTLPLPSLVRITNLENGRSIIVRVNDRGPYVNNRIIDVSRRTAQLLGFERKGTARVRVRILAEESRMLALKAAPVIRDAGELQVAAAPRATVISVALPPPPGTAATPASVAPQSPGQKRESAAAPEISSETEAALVTYGAARATEIFIQAGAFADPANAYRLKSELSYLGPTQVTEARIGGRFLYRVRLGPIAFVESADRLLDSVINAGYKDARLIVVE